MMKDQSDFMQFLKLTWYFLTFGKYFTVYGQTQNAVLALGEAMMFGGLWFLIYIIIVKWVPYTVGHMAEHADFEEEDDE